MTDTDDEHPDAELSFDDRVALRTWQREQETLDLLFDRRSPSRSPPDIMAKPTNSDTDAPLADGDTVHIHADDPMLVTRDGATYSAQDADEDGEPVGDPWPLSEGAVRGLLRRHDWTRVEATASVRGDGDE